MRLSQVGEGINKRHGLYILGEVIKVYVAMVPFGCGGSILASSLSSGVCVCVQSRYMGSPLNPGTKGFFPGLNSVVCPPPALYLPTEWRLHKPKGTRSPPFQTRSQYLGPWDSFFKWPWSCFSFLAQASSPGLSSKSRPCSHMLLSQGNEQGWLFVGRAWWFGFGCSQACAQLSWCWREELQ